MMKSLVVAAAALALVFSVSTAEGQFKGAGKYQAGIVEYETNTTDFSFAKEKSKVQIKPSKKGGDGGFVIQLNAKFIDCPSVGNDGGKEGKCGEKGLPVTNHVMEINLHVLGTLGAKTGILYNIEKGKTTFVDGGKNKIPAAAGGGALVSILYTTSIGIDGIRLRETGSDIANPTTGCATLPLPPSDTCTDGAIYGIAGFRAGEDPDTECTTTAQCDPGGATLICSGGLCVVESCSSDAECDQNGEGSGGTGQCNCNTNQCCDEANTPGCNSIC